MHLTCIRATERLHMGEPRSGERANRMFAPDLREKQDAQRASAGWGLVERRSRARDGR
jgi:hypothetical protein